jgi:hypothetical protein
MKRSIALIFVLLGLFASAQRSADTDDAETPAPLISFGANCRIIDRIPYEVFVRKIIPNATFGYQLKFAIGAYRPWSPYVSSSSTPGSLAIDYTAIAAVVKPGITLLNRVTPQAITLLTVSLNLAYTIQTLELTFTDPIYQAVRTRYVQNAIYPGAEVDITKVVRTGKNFFISGSFALGISRPQIDVFDKVIHDLSSQIQYAPGQGFGRGLYANMMVGVGFTL